MPEPKRPAYLQSKKLAKGCAKTWGPTAKERARIHRAYKRRWRNRLRKLLCAALPGDES